MATYNRKDTYYRQAKAKGLPSRASFKIIEILEKYQVIQPGMTVVDLGAAPGGWLKVLSDVVGPSGQVVGIDMSEIKDELDKNVLFIQGDIKDNRTRQLLLSSLGRKVEAVVSDLAPHTTGIAFQESFLSAELVREAMEICKLILKDNGVFLAKVYSGCETPELRNVLQDNFLKIQGVYPKSTRNGSKEAYLLCRSFKARRAAA